MNDEETFICARCTNELVPGRGDFFEVRLQATADPYPPRFELGDLNSPTLDVEHEELVRSLDEASAQEAMDSVAVHRILHLCNGCFQQWIEDPAAPA